MSRLSLPSARLTPDPGALRVPLRRRYDLLPGTRWAFLAAVCSGSSDRRLLAVAAESQKALDHLGWGW